MVGTFLDHIAAQHDASTVWDRGQLRESTKPETGQFRAIVPFRIKSKNEDVTVQLD